MEAKNLKSGFEVKNLILLESSFFRIDNVIFGKKGIHNEFNIDIKVGVNEKNITVWEEVTVVQKLKDIEQIKIRVKMAGLFESVGDSKIKDFDEFGRVNAAAIIFPYIREHVTNLSLKAGIAPIMLQPINFTKSRKK